MKSTLSKEEYIGFLEAFVNLDALGKLEASGAIRRRGSSSWYYILKPDKIPDNIARTASAKEEMKKGEQTIVLWRFPTASEVKKARTLLAKVRGH